MGGPGLNNLRAISASSGFASDGKINTILLNFGKAKMMCLFCVVRQNKIHCFTWADQDWIELIILKKIADQDWIGFNLLCSCE